MSGRHLFVADLHLRREEAGKCDAFIRLIRENAQPGVHLYILGDLFDLWIGRAQFAAEREWQPLFDAMKAFVDAGGQLNIFHGNRDFCMRNDMTRTLGAETVPASKTIDLDGRRVYLSHGDLLCTGDQLYHIARWLTRRSFFRLFWAVMPISAKYGLAGGYKKVSTRQDAGRRAARHGINRSTLRRLLTRGIDIIICGHIHEQTEMIFRRQGHQLHVKTLPAWEERGSVLEYADGRFTTRSVDFT